MDQKGSLKMPNRKARPVTVFAPQKGRSKLKGGIPLDELLAAHAVGPPVRTTKNTPTRAPAAAKASKAKPKKAPGARLRSRDDAQVVQDGPPRLVGYARISTDDQTTALQADALTRAAVNVVFEEERRAPTPRAPFSPRPSPRSGRAIRSWFGGSIGSAGRWAISSRSPRTARAGRLLAIVDRRVRHLDGFRRLLYHVLGAVASSSARSSKNVPSRHESRQETRDARRAAPGARGVTASRSRSMLAAGKSQIETARILRVSRATIQRAYPGGSGRR